MQTEMPLADPRCPLPPVFDWKGLPRPPSHHPEVKRRAIAELLPRVVAWLKEPSCSEEVASDLAKNTGSDGYAFARNLERDGWDPDSELVEILDGCSTHGAASACVKEWIEQNGVTPKLLAGAKVLLSPAWVSNSWRFRRHLCANMPSLRPLGQPLFLGFIVNRDR